MGGQNSGKIGKLKRFCSQDIEKIGGELCKQPK